MAVNAINELLGNIGRSVKLMPAGDVAVASDSHFENLVSDMVGGKVSALLSIEARGYVEKINKALHPTDTGEVVTTFLEEQLGQYISDTFTADMEDKLDLIADGKATYLKTLTDFYGPFLKDVKSKEKLDKATNLGDAPEDILCPICQSHMVIKLAKNGKFYSCSRYPDCMGARKLDGTLMEGPKKLGRKCPKCGDIAGKNGGGELMERDGRYGKFIACSNYPKCKYIEQDEEERFISPCPTLKLFS
jgi:DNA topoisomerase-1